MWIQDQKSTLTYENSNVYKDVVSGGQGTNSQYSSQYIESNLVSSDHEQPRCTLQNELEFIEANRTLQREREEGKVTEYNLLISADRSNFASKSPSRIPYEIHAREDLRTEDDQNMHTGYLSREAPLNFDKYLDQETMVSQQHANWRNFSGSPEQQTLANGGTLNFAGRTGQSHALTTL